MKRFLGAINTGTPDKETVNVVFDTEERTYSLFTVPSNKKIVLSEKEMEKLFGELDRIENYR